METTCAYRWACSLVPDAVMKLLTLIRLCIALFLGNLEISIVSTSLVSITDDLKHFGQSSWIVTSYLLTYTSFMIVLAKLSDVVGRKTILQVSLVIFTVFSGGCAAAQTMIQL
jgi:MFS family permease